MKRKLITHADLDGVVCALLASVVWDDDVETVYCGYDNVDAEVSHAIQNDDEIYITDICPSENVCKMIDQSNKDILLFDHHATKSFVSKYDWAEFDKDKCGAELFYEYLIGVKRDVKLYIGLVQIAKVRDTFQTNHYLWDIAGDLHTLLNIFGRERFVARFRCQPVPRLEDIENALCQLKRREKEGYVENSSNRRSGYRAGEQECHVVFADKLASEIGRRILEEENDTVAVVSLRHKKVEIRSNSIHSGDFAKQFHPNGGGHERAGGFMLSDDKIKRILDIVFEENR